MELQQIVERYAEAIEHVDVNYEAPVTANQRTGEIYHPGFKALNEDPAMVAVDLAWETLHPGERHAHLLTVRYPDLPAFAKVDHVFTTDSLLETEDEWSVEVKRLQFVGNNGKRNDYATTKVLSPYLKDRGMLHDALRLRQYGFTRRVAVVGYSFDYDSVSLEESRARHTGPEAVAVLDQIAGIMKLNGPLRTRSLIEFADAILGLRGLTTGPRAQAPFEAWTHPAGGRGVVFGWEIRRPEREPDYDPRHPW